MKIYSITWEKIAEKFPAQIIHFRKPGSIFFVWKYFFFLGKSVARRPCVLFSTSRLRILLIALVHTFFHIFEAFLLSWFNYFYHVQVWLNFAEKSARNFPAAIFFHTVTKIKPRGYWPIRILIFTYFITQTFFNRKQTLFESPLEN